MGKQKGSFFRDLSSDNDLPLCGPVREVNRVTEGVKKSQRDWSTSLKQARAPGTDINFLQSILLWHQRTRSQGYQRKLYLVDDHVEIDSVFKLLDVVYNVQCSLAI